MKLRSCRKLRAFVISALLWGGLLAALLPLGWVLFSVIRLGAPGLSLDFLIRPMRQGGTAGGVSGQIIGTLLLMAAALVVCLPGALACALWIGTPLPLPVRLKFMGERLLQLANAVPTVLLGLAGMLMLSRGLGLGKSWFVGGVVLGMMMLPTVTLALVERFRSTPRAQTDAATGLGLSPVRVITSIYMPRAAGGAITGTLLGLARAAGETAPILFTAAVFSGAAFPSGIRNAPVLALPYHIFVLAQDVSHPEAQERVWASALVLLLLVWLLALIVFPLRLRLGKPSHTP